MKLVDHLSPPSGDQGLSSTGGGALGVKASYGYHLDPPVLISIPPLTSHDVYNIEKKNN